MSEDVRVRVHDEQSVLEVAPDLVRAAARATLRAEGRPDGRLDVILCDDARIADLHEEHLGRSGPTDVISFPDEGDGVPDPRPEATAELGEIWVSVERAAAEAPDRDVPPLRELCRYVVHGVLHLLGETDGTPGAKARMWRKQEAVVRTLREEHPEID